MGSYSISKSLGEEDLNRLFSKWFVQFATIFRFTSFCCKGLYVTFEYCSFMFYACSLLTSYICSVKVMKYVWQSHHQAYTHCWCFLPVHQSDILLMWCNAADTRTWLMRAHLYHWNTGNSVTRLVLSCTQISALHWQKKWTQKDIQKMPLTVENKAQWFIN